MRGLPNGVDVKVTKAYCPGTRAAANQGIAGANRPEPTARGMAMQNQSHQGMAAAPKEEGKAMIDVAAHGAIFSSPACDGGRHPSALNLVMNWREKAIPYHSHLDHSMTGDRLQ